MLAIETEVSEDAQSTSEKSLKEAHYRMTRMCNTFTLRMEHESQALRSRDFPSWLAALLGLLAWTVVGES